MAPGNRIGSLLAYRACWRLGAVAAPIHHRGRPGGGVDRRAGRSPAGPRPRRAADRSPVGPEDGGGTPEALAGCCSPQARQGRPKAVLHTHQALAPKARLVASVHGVRPTDATLMPATGPRLEACSAACCSPAWCPQRPSSWPGGPRRASAHRGGQVSFRTSHPSPGLSPPTASARAVRSNAADLERGAGVSPAFVRDAERLGARVKRNGRQEAPTVATTTGGMDTRSGPPPPANRAPVGGSELRCRPGSEAGGAGTQLFTRLHLDAGDDAAALTATAGSAPAASPPSTPAGSPSWAAAGRDHPPANVRPTEVAAPSSPTVRQAVVLGEPTTSLWASGWPPW